MNGRSLLDTNILVYAFDTQEPKKRTIAKHHLTQLFTTGDTILSLQVINEFCNVAQKKLKPPMSSADIRTFIQLIPERKIASLTRTITVKALQLQQAHQLSFWDSMIVATAITEGCQYLITEDLSDSQTIE